MARRSERPPTKPSPDGAGSIGGVVWYRLAEPPRRADPASSHCRRATRCGDRRARTRSLAESRNLRAASPTAVGAPPCGFAARQGATYLIAIGHVENADPGTFRLETFLSEAAESTAGGEDAASGRRPLSVHGLTDVNDVWRVSMRPGTTYRIGFAASSCADVSLRARRQLTRRSPPLTAAATGHSRRAPTAAGEYVLEVESRRRTAGPALPAAVRGGCRRTILASASRSTIASRPRLARPEPPRRAGPLSLRPRPPATYGSPSPNGLRFQLLRTAGSGWRTYRLDAAAAGARPLRRRRHGELRGAPPRYALSLLVREITSTSLRLPRRGSARNSDLAAARRREGELRPGRDPDRPLRPADRLALQPPAAHRRRAAADRGRPPPKAAGGSAPPTGGRSTRARAAAAMRTLLVRKEAESQQLIRGDFLGRAADDELGGAEPVANLAAQVAPLAGVLGEVGIPTHGARPALPPLTVARCLGDERGARPEDGGPVEHASGCGRQRRWRRSETAATP